MRTPIVGAVVVLALVFAGGCHGQLSGSGSYATTPPGSTPSAGPIDAETAKHQAGDTLKQYWTALSRDNGQAACNELTDSMQRYLRVITGSLTCPTAASKAASEISTRFGADFLARLARVQFDYAKPEVDGNTVIFTSDSLIVGGSRGSSSNHGTTEVSRQPDGSWKISKLT